MTFLPVFTLQIVNNQFILSFTHRLSELRGATTFFSFCFPFSYGECQEMLEQLDKNFSNAAQLTPNRYSTHTYTLTLFFSFALCGFTTTHCPA